MLSQLVNSQKSAESLLQEAKDSIMANPGFAYKQLAKLLKKKDIVDTTRVKVNSQLANYFNLTGVSDSAIYYAQKALSEVVDKKQEVYALRILGSAYSRNGRKEEALPILFKSLKISESLNDKGMICKLKFDLGSLYFLKNDFDKALRFFKESKEVAPDNMSLAMISMNIGNVYVRKGDLDLAETYYEKTLKTIKPEENPNLVLSANTNVGAIALERKEYKKAEMAFINAKTIAEKYEFMSLYTLNTFNLGLVLVEKEAIDQGIESMEDALQSAEESGDLEHQKMVYDGLIQVYTKKQDYKNKSETLLKFHNIRDSINKLKFDKDIKELEVAYETSEKEKEIVRQKLNKKWILIGALGLLIPLAFLIFVFYQKHKTQLSLNHFQKEVTNQKINTIIKDHEIDLTNKAIEIQNQERERIGSQLHDVVGGNLALIMLNLSQSGIEEKELQPTQQLLSETLNQVRDLSHDLISVKINASTFIAVIQNHIDKIETASNMSIKLYANPEEELNEMEEKYQVILFKIIQELLTNTLKHSQSKKVDIHLNQHKQHVHLIFEDDGVGFELRQLKNGVGIQNIKKRIDALSGKMDIDTRIGEGTIVNLNFKLI